MDNLSASGNNVDCELPRKEDSNLRSNNDRLIVNTYNLNSFHL